MICPHPPPQLLRVLHRSSVALCAAALAGPLGAQVETPLVPTIASNVGFSSALDMAERTLVVATSDDPVQGLAGVVTVFERTAGGWSEDQLLHGSVTHLTERFGASISTDGVTIAVGAPEAASFAGSNRGAVYVFEREGGQWAEVTRLYPPFWSTASSFGASVCVRADRLVVGSPQNGLADGGGYSGGPGAAWIFEREGGVWSLAGGLQASASAPGDRFGQAVAVEGDRLLVGAPSHSSEQTEQGAVYSFERFRSGTWLEVQRIEGLPHPYHFHFGEALALRGELAVVGEPDDYYYLNQAGRAYVLELDDAGWQLAARLDPLPGAIGSGSAVDLDERCVLVGAPGRAWTSGCARLYAQGPNGWAPAADLVPSDGSRYDRFGSSVAVQGSYALVGAPHQLVPQGTAYLYDLDG